MKSTQWPSFLFVLLAGVLPALPAPAQPTTGQAILNRAWMDWEAGRTESALAGFAHFVTTQPEKSWGVVASLVCETKSLKEDVARLSPHGPVYLIHHPYKDMTCYRLLVGVFPDRKACGRIIPDVQSIGPFRAAFPVEVSLEHAPPGFLARVDELLGTQGRASESAPPPTSSAAAETERLFQEGLAALNGGDPETARTFFQQTLARDPEHAGAHNNLGTIYLHLGRFSDAEREYRLALKSNPGYRKARLNLSGALYGQNRKDEAVRELRRMVGEDPTDLEARINLTSLLLSMDMVEAARENLRILLQDHPTDPRVSDLAKRFPPQ